MQPAECRRQRDAQHAPGPFGVHRGKALGIIDGRQNGQYALVEALAHIGGGDTAGGALKEPHAQAVLQAGDPLGDHGRGGVQFARGRGQASGLDHPGEDLVVEQIRHLFHCRYYLNRQGCHALNVTSGMACSVIGTAAFTDCCGAGARPGKKKAALREERGR